MFVSVFVFRTRPWDHQPLVSTSTWHLEFEAWETPDSSWHSFFSLWDLSFHLWERWMFPCSDSFLSQLYSFYSRGLITSCFILNVTLPSCACPLWLLVGSSCSSSPSRVSSCPRFLLVVIFQRRAGCLCGSGSVGVVLLPRCRLGWSSALERLSFMLNWSFLPSGEILTLFPDFVEILGSVNSRWHLCSSCRWASSDQRATWHWRPLRGHWPDQPFQSLLFWCLILIFSAFSALSFNLLFKLWCWNVNKGRSPDLFILQLMLIQTCRWLSRRSADACVRALA